MAAWGSSCQESQGKLAFQAGDGHRWAPLEVSSQGKTGFSLVPSAKTGLVFTNVVTEESGAANRVLYNGSGVASGDFDNDGLPDVYFCSLTGRNRLYKNLGDWRFQDVTEQAGLGETLLYSRGAVFTDINGDRHLDLLVSCSGQGVRCFLNNGTGKFTDATASAGTANASGSTSLTLADIDGNGTLDLYVANYRPDDIRDRGRVQITMVKGRPILPGAETNRFVFLNGRLEECGQPDQLFLNDGTGRFKLVDWLGGTFLDESGKPLTEPPADWGLTASFRDVDGDLDPDLYVCNDYWTPDRFWINDGKGRFHPIQNQAWRMMCASSMSVDFSDIDRDGHLDFFVTEMLSRIPHLRKRQLMAQKPFAAPIGDLTGRPQVLRNTLFWNRGDTSFAEIAYLGHVAASDWSWTTLFIDVDLDGFDDLLIGAGHYRDVQDYDAEAEIRSRQHSWDHIKDEKVRQREFTRELMEHNRLYPKLLMPIVAFRNHGNCTFSEVTTPWNLNHPGVHQGLTLADFDLDGDLDLIVNNLNSPAIALRNDTPAGRVAVRLKGRNPNTQGIGAKVTLVNGAVPRQTTEVVSGGRYQSGSDPLITLATGLNPQDLHLEIQWRNGTRSRIPGIKPNRLYEIDEPNPNLNLDPNPNRNRPSPPIKPFFEEINTLPAHAHPELEFNDYERQSLLPFKLSQMGAGIAWFDLDRDGRDELILGSGRGGKPTVFRWDGQGGFVSMDTRQIPSVPDDLCGLIGWDNAKDGPLILASLAGYESGNTNLVVGFRLQGKQLLPASSLDCQGPNASAMALGDLDGNGQMALFVAGGVLPGQYPLSTPSKLFLWNGQQWRLDAQNSVVFDHIGIVNSAVWSDLTGDGIPELVLACEWGPIRVFTRRNTRWFEVTSNLGLDKYTGWWRGVTTGDLNNDGRMDIVAANWGLNSPYRASPEQPLVFLYGQWSQPGVMEILETEYVGSILAPWRQFMAIANAMPFIHEQFTTHKAYSEATVEELMGERLPLARKIQVNNLASMVFLNTGSGFSATALPKEVQLAPAFAVNIADFNGDGSEDVFLSQNFSALQPETTRLNAGLGIWLQGNGTGKLEPVSPSRSGIRIAGDQRGAAVCDFDQDGRVDLAVTQNGAPAKLFRNSEARPGLRVKLQGPPFNPNGIGAVLRVLTQDGQGPAREIHAGSGYWSQDSYGYVLAIPNGPVNLWIRWPGGRTTTTPIPPNTRQVTIDTEGKTILP